MEEINGSEIVKEKINYGQEFIDVLDCASEIVYYVHETVSNIRDKDKRMKKTRKRIPWIFPIAKNPEYRGLETSLTGSLKQLKGAAKKVVKGFNETNSKEIELVGEGLKETFSEREYRSEIRSAHLKNLVGTSIVDYGPKVSVYLKEDLKLKPSELFNSLLNLNHVGLTSFYMTYSANERSELTLTIKKPPKEESIVYRPPQVLRILTEDLKRREIEEMLDDGASAEINLLENVVYPDFRSTINFESKTQKVKIIFSKGGRFPDEQRKKWIKENVNLLTGFGLSSD